MRRRMPRFWSYSGKHGDEPLLDQQRARAVSARPSVYSTSRLSNEKSFDVRSTPGRRRPRSSRRTCTPTAAQAAARRPPERRRARAAASRPMRSATSRLRDAQPRHLRSPTVVPMTDRRLAIDAWESLFRAQHEVFDEISGDFDDTGLSQAEYDVLLTVTRGDEMTARLRDVTANMLISQPSVSRLVDRMAARGLIAKCPDPEDGRGSLVRATARGRGGVPQGRLDARPFDRRADVAARRRRARAAARPHREAAQQAGELLARPLRTGRATACAGAVSSDARISAPTSERHRRSGAVRTRPIPRRPAVTALIASIA